MDMMVPCDLPRARSRRRLGPHAVKTYFYIDMDARLQLGAAAERNAEMVLAVRAIRRSQLPKSPNGRT